MRRIQYIRSPNPFERSAKRKLIKCWQCCLNIHCCLRHSRRNLSPMKCLDEAARLRDSKDRMRNLKLILSYDGSDFSGWQVQPDAATVQGTLASAIGRITGEKVLPQGSGRTDAGVHALAQVVTFVTESSVPTANFVKALNDILPASVRVLEVRRSRAGFSRAPFGAGEDLSLSDLSRVDLSAVSGRYVWHYPYPLDEEAMARAAALVEGEHDFTSFAAVDPGARPRRRARSLESYGAFFLRPGSGRETSSSTRCGDRDSSTTWCAIWWGRLFWWAKERCRLRM